MSPPAVEAEQHVAALESLDLEGLRTAWQAHYGTPPALRSTAILRQLLSWRLQAEALGGLDTETRTMLARTGPVHAEGLHLGIGARLSRVWKGREVVVLVEESGFRWNGSLFPSLSAAATAIAGTRWNGPRFFGLRDAA